MNFRYYIGPQTEVPHIYGHDVAEAEVEGGGSLVPWEIVQGLMYLPSIYTFVLHSGSDLHSGHEVAGLVAAIGGPLLIGIILWVIAPNMARSIVSAAGKTTDLWLGNKRNS